MTYAASIAAFPMYDFPALHAVHDELWSALGRHLVRAGVGEVPARLDRDLTHEAAWSHPRLLLAQACEYPLAKSFASRVRLVATPRYRARGCLGATYRSAIIVRAGDWARRLVDLRGRKCVINEATSNSGMNLFRAALAPLAQGTQFFESVHISGSHRLSMESVVRGEADVAAIDCVTLAHLERIDPALRDAVRVLGSTPSSPSLPLITAAFTPEATLQGIRTALRALTEDPIMGLLRENLFLDGFDLEPKEGFSTVLQLERSASALGYARLH